MIAISSILSFDVYGTYINKHPSDKQLIRGSHFGVVFTSLFISSLATGLHKGGVDLNWTIYMLGIVICPGTFPTCFALLWKGQTKAAAIVSPILGLVCGFSVWFGTAYAYSGEITITSTGATLPCMFACLTSSFVPLPTSIFISLMWPEEFDWNKFREIERVRPEEHTSNEKFDQGAYFSGEQVTYMKRMSWWAAFWAIVSFAGQVLLWPLPMYGARMIFSKKVTLSSSSLANVS